VVFAGAGVSIGPPSDLPEFGQLATLVGEATIGSPAALHCQGGRYRGRDPGIMSGSSSEEEKPNKEEKAP
jgi:hypothetical protein